MAGARAGTEGDWGGCGRGRGRRKLVTARLGELDVEGEVRGALLEHLGAGEGPLDQGAALEVLREKGVIEGLVSRIPADIIERAARRPARSTSALHSAAGPGSGSGGRARLMVRVVRGVGFVEQLGRATPPPEDEGLRVSVQLLGQRFESGRVTPSAEPAFNATGVVVAAPEDLDFVGQRDSGAAADGRMHIAVFRQGGSENGSLVGTASMDWRGAVTAAGGKQSMSIELRSCSVTPVPVGALEVKVEVLGRAPGTGPGPRSSRKALQELQRRDKIEASEALARFMGEAKEWWGNYVKISPGFRHRNVKIVATGEDGLKWPVCGFLEPLRPMRLLTSPQEAAYWVALLGEGVGADAGGPLGGGRGRGGGDQKWPHLHSVFASGAAGVEEKALILCSLLLGFNLEAYVCVGKRSRAGAAGVPPGTASDCEEGHMWVATLGEGSDSQLFWEPSTGQQYSPKAAGSSYTAIACLFNHRAIFANAQEDSDPSTCSFELLRHDAWRMLDCTSVLMPERPAHAVMQPFGSTSKEVAQQEAALELELKNAILDGRSGKSISWSADLEYLLMPALAAYEREAKHGAPAAAAEGDAFQQAIRRATPHGFTFQGVPLQFPGRWAPLESGPILEGLLDDHAVQAMLAVRDPAAVFALRAMVFPYPEGVCSVWVMLAAQFPRQG